MGENDDVHVEEDDPGEGNGELPLLMLDSGLDVSGREVIWEVYIKLDILAARGIVNHV